MVVVVERRAAAVLRAIARGEPALWLTVNMTRRKACIPTTRESGQGDSLGHVELAV